MSIPVRLAAWKKDSKTPSPFIVSVYPRNAELRRALPTTNPIESAFSRVRTVCQNVKRWRDGDQRERWIASGLIFAEQKFRRIVGSPAMPKLVAILKAYSGDSKKITKSA